MRQLIAVSCASLLLSCAHEEPKPEPKPAPAPAAEAPKPPPPPKFDRVARADFNQQAFEAYLPLFWSADANQNHALDPDELAVFWNVRGDAKLSDFVQGGTFTPKFVESYEAVVKRAKGGADFGGLPAEEQARRKSVIEELRQARPTLVKTDLSKAPSDEQRFVQDVLKAAAIIDGLYEKQLGVFGLWDRVPEGDTQSHALFFRNHGFRCQAPKTQSDPNCSAIPNPPKEKLSGLYPSAPLQQPGFCEALGKQDKKLVDPFTVVVDAGGGKLAAKPYHEVWGAEMNEVSDLLKDAAQAFPAGKEDALKAYLTAAAQAFLDDNWVPADEAWAKMNAVNSKWYLRIAPDEVYAEPCSTKALFHVSFGSINQGSLKWQTLLDPLKADLEGTLAKLAGAPYKARTVTFHLPDFMDVVLNAGDSRNPSGATIGQSLPNFGPVANEGRGRTVAMVNLYSDPDSLADLQASAESLFCKSVMPRFTTDPEPLLMSTVLHEAAHNLGPAHQYKVKGKDDRAAFGGPLASTLEELKAQNSALYFTDWLAERKVITEEAAQRTHVRDLQWAFGHISRGMYDEEKHPRNYSQLAAMELGYFLQHGGMSWNKDELAANGKDQGCFAIDFPKLSASVKEMTKLVAGIKARGDRKAAEKLVKDYVDVSGDLQALHEVIRDRMLRSPKASFVYALQFE